MDFTHFFDKLESQESYTILFITIIGFLFGLLVGYLLRTAKVRRLRKSLNEAEANLSEKESQLAIAQQEIAKKNIEVEEARAEAKVVIDKLRALEADREKLYNQVYSLNAEVEQLQATNRTYASTIEELSDQIIGLKTQNEQLAEELASAQSAPKSTGQFESLQSDTLSRMEIFEAKLDRLTAENELLKNKIGGVQAAGSSTPIIVPTSTGSEEPELTISKGKDVLRTKVVTDDIVKDDLTQIGGVGPFIQQQLYDAGIFTYEQISQFDTAAVENITREIGYFPGRIEKDGWVAQAKKLMKSKKAPAKKSKKNTYKTDDQDLKIIEGIGPKIEGILKAAGINNWTELSASSHKRLRTILDEAGSRYKMHDPESWGKQATLAANDKWDDLKALQDKLKGGRS
jgi:predicted flap endonuclease-1-like 5' DNA nuclease